MPILTKEVEIKPNGKMIQYYKDLGYDAKWNQPLIIKIEDLSKGSKIRVEVECDICKDTKKVAYKDYVSSIEKYGYYTCLHCNYIKQQETTKNIYGVYHASQLLEFKKKQQESCQLKYGVSNPMQSEDIKKKAQSTNYEKYGVKNVTQNAIIREKQKNTLMSNYGVDNPTKNKEIRELIEHNMVEKYGVKYPLQIPEAMEKARQTWIKKYNVDHPNKSNIVRNKTESTCLERYGVNNPLQSPEVREKITQTLYANFTQKSSRQQRYINNLYQGILNFPIKHYNVDIYLSDDNLIVEYDGGFHMGNIITGRETQEEFNQKEIIRNNIIKREGYKQMRIISTTDKLPSDTILLEMLDFARNYFSIYPQHSWIEFNIDTSFVYSAEYKDGIPYSYGSLRTIKDSDLYSIKDTDL